MQSEHEQQPILSSDAKKFANELLIKDRKGPHDITGYFAMLLKLRAKKKHVLIHRLQQMDALVHDTELVIYYAVHNMNDQVDEIINSVDGVIRMNFLRTAIRAYKFNRNFIRQNALKEVAISYLVIAGNFTEAKECIDSEKAPSKKNLLLQIYVLGLIKQNFHEEVFNTLANNLFDSMLVLPLAVYGFALGDHQDQLNRCFKMAKIPILLKLMLSNMFSGYVSSKNFKKIKEYLQSLEDKSERTAAMNHLVGDFIFFRKYNDLQNLLDLFTNQQEKRELSILIVGALKKHQKNFFNHKPFTSVNSILKFLAAITCLFLRNEIILQVCEHPRFKFDNQLLTQTIDKLQTLMISKDIDNIDQAVNFLALDTTAKIFLLNHHLLANLLPPAKVHIKIASFVDANCDQDMANRVVSIFFKQRIFNSIKEPEEKKPSFKFFKLPPVREVEKVKETAMRLVTVR